MQPVQPRHPLRWALVSCTPQPNLNAPSFHTHHGAPLMNPSALQALPIPSLHPPRCIHGWILGCWTREAPQGPPVQTSTSLGAAVGAMGSGEHRLVTGSRATPVSLPPPPPFAPLRHPHEFPGSL